MFKLRTELTEDLVKTYIQIHKAKYLPRLKKLERYYVNKNDRVNNRTFADPSKPNNKESHAYAAYIVDTLASYMVGKPVTYTSENKELLANIVDINNYNDSEDNDLELAEQQGIYGVAFEAMYIDEYSQVRFKALDTKECIPIFDGTLENNLKYLIRYYEEDNIQTGETILFVEVYDSKGCSKYTGSNYGTLTLEDTIPSSFDDIPINVYLNNNRAIGDFELIIPQLDSYDIACSDTLNNLEYFSDAYLLFKNVNIDSETVNDMKNNRIICIEGEAGLDIGVDWLTKNANTDEVEKTKDRLVNEIHKLSKVPNLDPSAFVSHTTASHVFYSLLATEDVVAKKEKKFKKGLQQRIEKIVAVINLKTLSTHDYRDIALTFKRNIPQALESVADPISKLRGLVSDETLLGIIPGVTDVEAEIAKVEQQNRLNSYELSE